MGKEAAAHLADEAHSLLRLFGNSSEAEMTRHADNVLSFFRKLNDLSSGRIQVAAKNGESI